MRVLRWDDGTKWGDINARWGSPSYVLEPGDPGYRIPPDDPSLSSSSLKTRKPTAMSSNATPENRTILVPLAVRIHAGQIAIGASVGLAHHLAPEMDLRIKKLMGDPAAAEGSAANKGSQFVYRDCVTATDDAVADLAALSNGPVKDWLQGYQKMLQGVHGKRSNADWVAAGFAPGTTSVPRSHHARLVLLQTGRAYLSAHPDYQTDLPRKDLPPLQIRPAAALALSDQMTAALALIASRKGEQELCKNARDADLDALYTEVSEAIAEIDGQLEDDDPRYLQFGLNIPANPSLPEGVASLTATAAGPDKELLEWPYAARVEYFRLWVKREGVDEDFVNVADPRDLAYTLKNLPAGTVYAAYVEAENAAGAGPASPTVTRTAGA
jgi:hypothetical protein